MRSTPQRGAIEAVGYAVEWTDGLVSRRAIFAKALVLSSDVQCLRSASWRHLVYALGRISLESLHQIVVQLNCHLVCEDDKVCTKMIIFESVAALRIRSVLAPSVLQSACFPS